VVGDTSKPLGRLHAHHVTVEAGTISLGQAVQLSVDVARRDRIRANHSATHLLHAALRNLLGDHVTQKGSQVADDKLRFDFSHSTALSAAELAQIDAQVNAQVRGNVSVSTRLMTPDDAVAAGAMALFGEKYGDEVRVLSMGASDETAYSVELCGGTHVHALGDIGLFKIVSEGAVASGIRRIEALTGEAARLWLTARDDSVKAVAASLKTSPEDVPARVAAMADSLKKLERELADAKRALALGGAGGAVAEVETINGIMFQGQLIENLDPKDLRNVVVEAKTKLGSGIAAALAITDGRASVAVAVSGDLLSRFNSVDFVKAAVGALGGQGGGGRPEMAQGGGPDGKMGEAALEAIRLLIKSAV
jgi:alanyl-tRNA synthetase